MTNNISEYDSARLAGVTAYWAEEDHAEPFEGGLGASLRRAWASHTCRHAFTPARLKAFCRGFRDAAVSDDSRCLQWGL